jgi:hypothetical protein
MRVKIVGLGHFVTDTRFKFVGAFAKDPKGGTSSDTSTPRQWK